jgi:hypothetical protein
MMQHHNSSDEFKRAGVSQVIVHSGARHITQQQVVTEKDTQFTF